MLTKGAETAVRAVEAARGVTRHFRDFGEKRRAERIRRPREYEARLPAPESGGAAVLDTQRVSNSVLATVVMGAVVIGACFLVRAYFEQHTSTLRANALPVAVVGAVRPAPPKVEAAADKLVESRPVAVAAQAPVVSASPLIAVAASSKDSVTEKVVPARSVEKKKAPAVRAQRTQKVAAKPAAVCSHKSDRTCAKNTQRVAAAKVEPKQKQASKQPLRRTEVARAKPATKEIQKVAAIPAPTKPAMVSDGSWKPSTKKN
ncbi:hypothetical protein [Caballeronia pedi]|uniref:hypothetical protein n=1 Tax=Caballeronia pedi TaxID=1777141 RepID=UPI00077233E2|nr:hypothetical protein [Caballeronia pedi]